MIAPAPPGTAGWASPGGTADGTDGVADDLSGGMSGGMSGGTAGGMSGGTAGAGPAGARPAHRAVRPVETLAPVVPLRPLVLSDVLDGAVTLVRRHPGSTLGVGIVGTVLTQLAAFGLSLTTLGRKATTQNVDGSQTTDGTTALLSLASSELSLVVRSLAVLILSGFAAVALRREVLGLPGRFGDVWGDVRPRLAAMIGAALLSSLVVIACTATQLGIPAAVFFYVAWALAPTAIALEGHGATGGLRRSLALVRGSWWRVLGFLLVTLLVTTVVGGVIGIPFDLLSQGVDLFDTQHTTTVSDLALQSVGAALAGALTLPFTAGVHAVLYLDQRVRVEAFDVDLAQATIDLAARR